MFARRCFCVRKRSRHDRGGVVIAVPVWGVWELRGSYFRPAAIQGYWSQRPEKTTPPLLFPTSVPFLTHVNFSRVFLRFYHSQGIRTNIHPETKSAKSFFHEPFLFSAMFVCKFPGKKTWRPVAATLAQTSHPKNTHRGNFAVQRLGKRKAPCQMWLSQKCLTVRPWAVF